MAKRWLRAEVIKEVVGHVYVCVDDEKIPVTDFGEKESCSSRILITGPIRRAVQSAIDHGKVEWEETSASVHRVVESHRKEASKNNGFDASDHSMTFLEKLADQLPPPQDEKDCNDDDEGDF